MAAETRHLVDHEWSRSAQLSSAQPSSALHITRNQDTASSVGMETWRHSVGTLTIISEPLLYRPIFYFTLFILLTRIQRYFPEQCNHPSPLCLHQAVCSVHEPMTSRPLPWYLVSSAAETVTSPSPSPWSWRPSSSICWPSSGTGRQSSSTTSRASRSDKKLKLSTNLREGSTIAEKAPTWPQFHIYLPSLGTHLAWFLNRRVCAKCMP